MHDCAHLPLVQRSPHSGRLRAHRPRLQPRHRRRDRPGRPGDHGGGGRRGGRRGRGRARLAAHLPVAALGGPVRLPSAAARPRRRAGRDRHRRARQGALRRPRRDRPRPGERRVRRRCPPADEGRVLRAGRPGVDVYWIRQPLGVVAGITPFNFPVMVPLWMFANAIACGNAFVLKPSEKDPSASLFLAELWPQAGLPDGVFNVVHGDKEAVDALLEHPDVAAISFVGSTPIAQHDLRDRHRPRQAGPGPRRRQEPHAGAARRRPRRGRRRRRLRGLRLRRGALHGGLGRGGRRRRGRPAGRCDRGPAAQARDRPRHRPGLEMGPLITREHRDKVASYVDAGRGRRRHRGGRRPAAPTCRRRASSSGRRSSTT